MNYKGVADLNADIKRWLPQLPGDLDLVVGIPRSGMLAANVLALHLNVPLADLDGYLDGRVLSTGERYRDAPDATPKRVLVLDDSVRTGAAMTEARERLDDADLPGDVELLFGAVYVTPQGRGHVDTYAEVVGEPRVFEWNMMHHPGFVPRACFDLDGVLCRDPTPQENDDGERYREFIRTVEPLVVPSERIGKIVTARLEKYRGETEAWLDGHGIEYDELVMLNLPDMETRRRLGAHAEFKARVYDESDAVLFVESDHGQALEIARRTDRPVYSVEYDQMIRQDRLTVLSRESQQHLRRLRSEPLLFVERAGEYFVDRTSAAVVAALARWR